MLASALDSAMAYSTGCTIAPISFGRLNIGSRCCGRGPAAVREIIREVCDEMGVTIMNGALPIDHVHMLVEIPPHVSVSDIP